MKASNLLKIIRKDLNHLNKNINDTDRLTRYNLKTYDEIFSGKLKKDFEIDDKLIESFIKDIDFYFDKYGADNRKFIKSISLYLALIAEKPLHPYSDNKDDQVYFSHNAYYCKIRAEYIDDENSLCRYCVCRELS